MKKSARASATEGGDSIGNPAGIGGRVFQACHQIREVTRLVDLPGVDRRLPVLSGDNEQRRFVDTLALERLNHIAQSFVGFLQSVSANVGRGPSAGLVAAGFAIQGSRFVNASA